MSEFGSTESSQGGQGKAVKAGQVSQGNQGKAIKARQVKANKQGNLASHNQSIKQASKQLCSLFCSEGKPTSSLRLSLS
jgi:hypothetical protein